MRNDWIRSEIEREGLRRYEAARDAERRVSLDGSPIAPTPAVPPREADAATGGRLRSALARFVRAILRDRTRGATSRPRLP